MRCIVRPAPPPQAAAGPGEPSAISTLAGKTVVVTGGAAGVGFAAARQFLEAGARVMLADPDDKALDRAYKELKEEGGELARFHYQVQDKLSVANLLAATLDAFDSIHVLLNDLRVSVPGSLLELSADDFNAVLTHNVRSVFLLGQQVARRMIQQRQENPEFEGSIIVVSSIAAQRTVPELVAYSVACAALDQLTRSMAAGLAEERIRVNAIALGSIMTGTLREALRERSDLREEMVQVTPLGRIGDAEEAASAAFFLASDKASFITGQVLAIDGGRSVLDPLSSPVR